MENTVLLENSNVIDKWIIGLTDKFDGWGMVLYVLITVTLSAVLSALIGLERYRRGKSAGMRTHALLSVGCSFLMTISIWAINKPNPEVNYDISRIAAGAVAGIGFLGAGVITKDKFTVKGLSTATTLWVCAAVGLAVGAGFIVEGAITALIALGIFLVVNKIIKFVDRDAPHVIVEAKKGYCAVESFTDRCNKNNIEFKNIVVTSVDKDKITAIAYFPYNASPAVLDYFITLISNDEEVISAKQVWKNKSKQ